MSHRVTRFGEVAGTGFDPWQAADEHADLHVAFHPVAGLMGGGFHARNGAQAVIVLDPELDGPHRRAVLTHELVHHERGGGPARVGTPVTLALLVARDERAVDDEVARRLVPVDELASVVEELVGANGGATDRDVAGHFGVPLDVARRAMHQLANRA